MSRGVVFRYRPHVIVCVYIIVLVIDMNGEKLLR